MRKTRSIDNSVEFFSVKRAEDSIARCDIVILVLDAEAGITEQDKKVADRIVEDRRACIVVVNKWDLFDEEVRAGAPGGNRSAARRKTAREGQAKADDHARRIRRVGAEKTVLPGLRAGDFHLGQIGFSPGPLAGGGSLCRRAVAEKNPDRHSEPHAAGRCGAPPARQRARPSVEIFLRDPSPAGAADFPALSSTGTSSSPTSTKNTWPARCAERLATKAAPSSWPRNRVRKPSKECGTGAAQNHRASVWKHHFRSKSLLSPPDRAI